MSESKVAETAFTWTESRMADLTGIITKAGVSSAEYEIRRSCLTKVVASQGNALKVAELVEHSLDRIVDQNLFLNSGLTADCISCWRVFPDTRSINREVLFAISGRIKPNHGLPLSMSEGILIGLIELFTDCIDDQDLFCALSSTEQYRILTMISDSSICVSREGSGRLSNSLRIFLARAWDTSSKHGPNRLVNTLILIERYSRVYKNESVLVCPDMTYCQPERLFEYFLSELAARLFLSCRFQVRIDILSSFASRHQLFKTIRGS